MLTINKFFAATFSTGYMDLRWEINPTEEDTTIYKFYLYRAGAEQGPWVDLTPTGLEDRYSFRDSRVNLLSKRKDYFYKLKVVNTITSEEEEYGPIRHDYEPDIVALDIARVIALNLEKNIGQKCLVFPKKRSGARCSCYDRKLGHKVRSDCLSCYGTGWVGGYDTPIFSWINLIEMSDNLNQTEIGNIEKNYGQALLSSYPVIEPWDLIVDQTNRRWRVLSPVNYRKKGGTLIKQLLTLSQIEPSEIEYKIPIKFSDYSDYIYDEDHYVPISDYYPVSEIETGISIEDESKEIYGEKRFRDIPNRLPKPSID